jgi:hypothetical protein
MRDLCLSRVPFDTAGHDVTISTSRMSTHSPRASRDTEVLVLIGEHESYHGQMSCVRRIIG